MGRGGKEKRRAEGAVGRRCLLTALCCASEGEGGGQDNNNLWNFFLFPNSLVPPNKISGFPVEKSSLLSLEH